MSSYALHFNDDEKSYARLAKECLSEFPSANGDVVVVVVVFDDNDGRFSNVILVFVIVRSYTTAQINCAYSELSSRGVLMAIMELRINDTHASTGLNAVQF